MLELMIGNARGGFRGSRGGRGGGRGGGRQGEWNINDIEDCLILILLHRSKLSIKEAAE